MTQIFISYAKEDRALAAKLADGLNALGCSVWWDRKIQPGMRYDREIERELKSASVVVVLWTRHSLDKEWINSEASIALKRNTLFPVLVNDVEPPLHFLLRQSVQISLNPSGEFDDELGKLIKNIAATSRMRDQVKRPLLQPDDWRYLGGFEAADVLLSMLPQKKPNEKTRYELCREAIENENGWKLCDFKKLAKETFDQFTSETADDPLPNQQDALTALLLAHQLTEEYSKFGKAVRTTKKDNKQSKPINIPHCFNRIYLNTVNTFVKDIFVILADQDRSRSEQLGILAQEQDVAAAYTHIIKNARIELRKSGERAFAGPEINATYSLGRVKRNLPFLNTQEILSKFEHKLDSKLGRHVEREDDLARQLRLMRRTVLLSRAMSGSKDSLKRYINLVQNSLLETDVNAGFHLEYYCDQRRDEQLPLSSRDEGGTCNKTLAQLLFSLQQALAAGLNRSRFPLYLVETYTLASIVARRLHGPYDEVVRKALPVVEKLHKQTEDENTKIFLELLLDVASSGPEFPVREFGRYIVDPDFQTKV